MASRSPSVPLHDLRRAERRDAPYRAYWTMRPEFPSVPIFGTDLSATGAGVVSPEPILLREFFVRLAIRGRLISVRAKIVRRLPYFLRGRSAFRYGLEFTEIAPEDADELKHWTDD